MITKLLKGLIECDDGVILAEIPENLFPTIHCLVKMGFLRIQDNVLLKPNPLFFTDVYRLKRKQQIPLVIFDARGQLEQVDKLIRRGEARIINNPALGQMVVRL